MAISLSHTFPAKTNGRQPVVSWWWRQRQHRRWNRVEVAGKGNCYGKEEEEEEEEWGKTATTMAVTGRERGGGFQIFSEESFSRFRWWRL